MGYTEELLSDFDFEMAGTRRTLERVPEDKLGWKPHEKSPTMGWLATHLANLPHWGSMTVASDSLDIAPGGAQPPRPPIAASRKELLELFDRNVAEARAAIAAAGEARFGQPWTLLAGGKTIFTLPRIAVLRRSVLHHLVHHRAQLGVYLRLNGVPVPALYGPSADET